MGKIFYLLSFIYLVFADTKSNIVSSRISSSSKRWQYREHGRSFWPSEVRPMSGATFKIPAGGATPVLSSRQAGLTSKRDQWRCAERLVGVWHLSSVQLLFDAVCTCTFGVYFYSLLLWTSTPLHFGRRYCTSTALHLLQLTRCIWAKVVHF